MATAALHCPDIRLGAASITKGLQSIPVHCLGAGRNWPGLRWCSAGARLVNRRTAWSVPLRPGDDSSVRHPIRPRVMRSPGQRQRVSWHDSKQGDGTGTVLSAMKRRVRLCERITGIGMDLWKGSRRNIPFTCREYLHVYQKPGLRFFNSINGSLLMGQFRAMLFAFDAKYLYVIFIFCVMTSVLMCGNGPFRNQTEFLGRIWIGN